MLLTTDLIVSYTFVAMSFTKLVIKGIYGILFLCLNLSVINCNIINNEKDNYAYLGGEIINPKDDWVIIFNTKNKSADTIKLDASNRFMHKIADLTSGLYSIRHGGEYQMVLIEPTDSIMFRLNTYDFDESLVFTGKGSKKNNYLINTYLENEAESKKLVKHAKMQPEAFNTFIEKRRLKQLNSFKDFTEKNKTSEFFKSIITANINYNAYADKEIYPFAYFGNNKLVHFKHLPQNFYDYRKNVDYNASELGYFFSYNRFLFSHIDNLALDSFYEFHPFHTAFNRHSTEYNIAKLELIDSLITDDVIKNNLLKYKTRAFINNHHNHDEEDTVRLLDHFLSKSTSEKDRNDMKNLVASLQKLELGKKLPKIPMIDLKGNTTDLTSVIDKPSIIFFWSTNLKSQYRNSHYKVKELKSKFPNIAFISVNISDNNDESWKGVIDQYNFTLLHEYKFKDAKQARKILAVNYLDKAIVVSENGLIMHPDANIYNSDFENELSNLLKKRVLASR